MTAQNRAIKLLGKIELLQTAAIVFVLIEIIACIIAFSAPRILSIWVGLISLLIFIPLFLIFLVTLTYGPVVKNFRLAVIIFVMLVSNISFLLTIFAIEYRWLHFKDGCIDFWQALYFSIVTWTTLGYGDIVPLGWARALAASEALVGYLIMGVLVAALVTMARRDK